MFGLGSPQYVAFTAIPGQGCGAGLMGIGGIGIWNLVSTAAAAGCVPPWQPRNGERCRVPRVPSLTAVSRSPSGHQAPRFTELKRTDGSHSCCWYPADDHIKRKVLGWFNNRKIIIYFLLFFAYTCCCDHLTPAFSVSSCITVREVLNSKSCWKVIQ